MYKLRSELLTYMKTAPTHAHFDITSKSNNLSVVSSRFYKQSNEPTE